MAGLGLKALVGAGLDGGKVRCSVTQRCDLPGVISPGLDVLFDEQRDPAELCEANRYALMQSGWDRGRLVRGNLLYVVIEAGKVVVEYDGMEQGITDELIARGVAEEDVVLAWLPQPVEEGPGYAVATEASTFEGDRLRRKKVLSHVGVGLLR